MIAAVAPVGGEDLHRLDGLGVHAQQNICARVGDGLRQLFLFVGGLCGVFLAPAEGYQHHLRARVPGGGDLFLNDGQLQLAYGVGPADTAFRPSELTPL